MAVQKPFLFGHMSWRVGVTPLEIGVASVVGVGGGLYVFGPAVDELKQRQAAILAEREKLQAQQPAPQAGLPGGGWPAPSPPSLDGEPRRSE